MALESPPHHYLEGWGVPVTLSQPLDLVLGPSWSVEPGSAPQNVPLPASTPPKGVSMVCPPHPSFGQLMPPDPASGCHHLSSDGPLTLISALGVSPLPPGLGGHVIGLGLDLAAEPPPCVSSPLVPLSTEKIPEGPQRVQPETAGIQEH